MAKLNELLEKAKLIIVSLLVLLIPLSLLPIIPILQTSSSIIPIVIFAFGGLLLLLISFTQLFLTKKITLSIGKFDLPIFLLLSSTVLSLILVASNKIQAILNIRFGLVMIVALSLAYYYGKRYIHNKIFTSVIILTGFVISVAIIVFSLESTPRMRIISQELLIYLGFVFMYHLGSVISSFSKDTDTSKGTGLSILTVVSIALVISFVSFLTQKGDFPSLVLSLKASLQIFRHPLTSLFGFGVDNYSFVFDKVKDVEYIKSSLWKQPSPGVDRSTLFYILTTTGLVGFSSFLFLILSLLQRVFFSHTRQKEGLSLMLATIYIMSVMLVFPPSFLLVFLLFFLAMRVDGGRKDKTVNILNPPSFSSYLILLSIGGAFFVVVSTYLSSFALADYYFIQSNRGIKQDKFVKVYDNQRQALFFNPNLEEYHTAFSQLHLVLADTIIASVASKSAETTSQQSSPRPLKLANEDKQALIEAFDMAIREIRTTISLNPKKAEYWSQLAQIYAYIPKEIQPLMFGDGVDPKLAALSFYKKAIELDHNNPAYYFAVSQIYFTQDKQTEGLTHLKKAIELKPNWPGAHYELAAVYAQKGDTANSIKELEITLDNLDPIKDKKQYDEVNTYLNNFKNGQETTNKGSIPNPPVPGNAN